MGAARASREGPGSVPAAGGTANGDEGESAGRENALDPSEPEDASETSRQRLRRWLTQGEHDFETLRDALGLGVRALERELRHVARSARREGRRLAVQEAACLDCGFVFDDRSDRHLHPPSRCPGCRSQRIAPPRFRLTGSGTRR